jgi:hypothetical protein
MSKTYNLFISHSWAHGDAYEKLINLLDGKSHFSYKNYSVPKDDPIHMSSGDQQLYNAIKRQISSTHVVIILAGVYATYSRWIDKEIDIAKDVFKKPIIAVQPWGAERTSVRVKQHADCIVGWNTDSIVSAIRELA